MRARRGAYQSPYRFAPEIHGPVCERCREPVPTGVTVCGDCRAETKPSPGPHISLDSPSGRLGPLSVTCHTVEARRLFGVSGEGPYEFDRTEAWAYAARLRFLYGPDAVFS